MLFDRLGGRLLEHEAITGARVAARDFGGNRIHVLGGAPARSLRK
jgi:hypothetical protein